MTNSIDYSRKWYVLTAVAISILLGTISSSIVNVALPTLVRELDSTFPAVQWVVLVYLLTQATLMPIIGRLGDMIGRKSIFLSGFVVFTVGSILCGLSPNVYWLIGFRVIQAVGGAMTSTLGFAIIVDAFPNHERGMALGLNSTFSSTGIVLGPTIGGFIIDILPWQWMFFVTIPLAIIGIVTAIRVIPESTPQGGQRFDYSGAVTLFLSLMALLLALTLGQQLGFADITITVLFGAAIFFLIAFIIIEWRISQPMIELRLFKNQLFTVNLTTRLVTFIALAGTILLLPFYLENVLAYSTRQVGLLLTIIPICLGTISPLSGFLADRFGDRKVMTAGVILLVIGYFSLSTLDGETTALEYIILLLPVGVGMGIFQAPNNSALMGAVPPERLGVASGLVSITRTLGQTMGVAIMGALWAGRTMFHFGEMLPGGVTTASTETQIAGLQDTFLAVTFLVILVLILNVRLLMLKQPTPGGASSPAGS